MPIPPEGSPKPAPDEIALQMLEQFVRLNNHLDRLHEERINPAALDALSGLLDEMNDWFAVVDKTMENLNKNNSEKRKLSLSDFAQAWEMAAEEILSEDDDDEDGDVIEPIRGSRD